MLFCTNKNSHVCGLFVSFDFTWNPPKNICGYKIMNIHKNDHSGHARLCTYFAIHILRFENDFLYNEEAFNLAMPNVHHKVYLKTSCPTIYNCLISNEVIEVLNQITIGELKAFLMKSQISCLDNIEDLFQAGQEQFMKL